MQFYKPALTVSRQIALLQDRGLEIEDEARVRRYLSNISYYRLSAYMHPFQTDSEQEKHNFKPGTRFEEIANLYSFDRELRFVLLDAIEQIEVSLRCQLTTVIAEHHGSHGWTNADIFDTRYDHNKLKNLVEQKVRTKRPEVFLNHYRQKYVEPELPPVWMVMEILTFVEVSKLFSNFRYPKDKQRIAHHFGVPDAVLRSWFRSLSDLRNICAHHARVWNREFSSRPVIPQRQPAVWPSIPEFVGDSPIRPQRRLYMMLVVVKTLLQRIDSKSRWHKQLYDLLQRNPNVPRQAMGFPERWEHEQLWNS